MVKTSFAEMDCSVARTLEVIGEKWSLLILRDSFYGIRRFEDFQADLGIARNILSDRLKSFVDNGILERRRYEDRPPRYEYRLTEKGRDLLPVMLTMMRWGDKWGSGAPPVTLTHTACGHETHPVMSCSHCHQELTLREVVASPLPIQPREAVGI